MLSNFRDNKYVSEKPNHGCSHVKAQFQNALTKVFECSLVNTTGSFDFCRNCSFWYADLLYRFQLLSTVRDVDPAKNKNVTCIGEIFDLYRINIWSILFTSAQNLWTESNCFDCYDGWNKTINDKDEVVPQTLSNNTLNFIDLTNQLYRCISKVENMSAICNTCEDKYLTLNAFYSSLSSQKHDTLCYDISFSMNRTRRYWSGDLNCCRDETSNYVTFIALSVIIGILPIVFYSSVYIITKREEARMAQPLNNGETRNIERSVNNDPVPGTSSNDFHDANL